MFRLVAVVLLVLIVLFFAGMQMRLETKVEAEFALRWTMQTLGVIIAAIAAGGLLLQCFVAAPTMDRISPFLIAALTGLLLFNQSWMVAVTLSVACLAVVLPVFKRS